MGKRRFIKVLSFTLLLLLIELATAENQTNSNLWLSKGYNIYSNTFGNVGIGTTSPNQKLTVVGAINFSSYSKFGGLFIDNEGRVGIGTQNPFVDFEIVKNGGGAWQQLMVYDNSWYHRGIFNIVRSRGTSSSPSPVQAGDYLGSYGFLGQGITQAWDAAGIVSIAESNFNDTSTEAALTFTTAPAKFPIERVRISSNGNVGIGTTSPKATLDVNGTMRLAPLKKAPACNANTEGTIYYNSVSKQFYGCNGRYWTAFTNNNK